MILNVERTDVGFSGHVRPGEWVPLRLTVDNPTADDVELRFVWTVEDADGDRVAAERTAVINAQREERLWLYAPLPLEADRDTTWTVQALSTDAEGDNATQTVGEPVSFRVDPTRWAEPGTGLIAVMSEQDLGLDDYAAHATQHEPLSVVRGLSLADLPDRAHALSALDAIIWTADSGGDPADASIPSAVFPALREYVLRGGHLVVVLPRVGQTWTQSPLAGLLPVSGDAVKRVTAPPPMLAGVKPDVPSISLHTFDVTPAGDATVLGRTDGGDAFLITARRGFGKVTLVGVDITDNVWRDRLSSGKSRVWNTVFNWTAPVFQAAEVRRLSGRAQTGSAEMRPASELASDPLASFVPGRIAMRGTVSVILLVAVGLLFLYVAAAAGSFWWVKAAGRSHLAWLAFAGVVVAFSAFSWGGAWLARPTGLQARHMSVLTIDPAANAARVRSWVSLFVPRFGEARVAVPAAAVPGLLDEPTNHFAGFGVSADGSATGFLDAQRYAVAAAQPYEASLPVRATTKRLTLDVVSGETLDTQSNTNDDALLGPGAIEALEPPSHDLNAGRLRARLRHNLPGELHDVTVVYCRGEGYRGRSRRVLTPTVWRVMNNAGQRQPWSPGQTLEIDGEPSHAQRLFLRRSDYLIKEPERSLKDEGFLGLLLEQQRGVADNVTPGNDTVTREFELLSFFDAMPPPRFDIVGFSPTNAALRRTIGRTLDLSDLLHGPRLIILGQLHDSPLPVDLTVDGVRPPSSGWTVVRLIYDL